MEIAMIMDAILKYGSVILGIVFLLTTATQMIVEVAKRLLPRVPTDLVVFLVAVALTVLALLIYTTIMEITVMWYYAVGAVVLGIGVAYAAMFGWEKFTSLWGRLTEFGGAEILPGIDAELLTDDQLRSILRQMGYAYTDSMTREDLLAALDEAQA